MLEIPYRIYLSHGETLLVDWKEAYDAYKAVCIRKKIPFLNQRAYLNRSKIELDGLVFSPHDPSTKILYV